jgi:integrase
MQGMTRLINLLKRLYEEGKSNDELVFTTPDGKRMRRTYIQRGWQYNTVVVNGRSYTYNGVVMELAEEGKLQYLKPYSTRHTFISIQANNGADLALLADSCGNSVDVIIQHYLDKNRNTTLKDI